jgi:hypothetical protein
MEPAAGWDWSFLVDCFRIWNEDFNSPDGFGSGVTMKVWIQSQIPIISDWTKLLVDKREEITGARLDDVKKASILKKLDDCLESLRLDLAMVTKSLKNDLEMHLEQIREAEEFGEEKLGEWTRDLLQHHRSKSEIVSANLNKAITALKDLGVQDD